MTHWKQRVMDIIEGINATIASIAAATSQTVVRTFRNNIFKTLSGGIFICRAIATNHPKTRDMGRETKCTNRIEV